MRSTKLWILIAALLVFLPILLAFLLERIPPATIGVKVMRWGGGGVIARDYEQGFHLGITGVHKWFLLPKQTHFLHFTGKAPSRSSVDRFEPPLEIRSRDNNVLTIELSVPYRILEGQGHFIVQKRLKQRYQDLAKSTVEDVLRGQLAELSSEGVQNTERRQELVNQALPILNQSLAKFHVAAEAILVRRFSFPNQYEEKLQEKQYLQQKANLDLAMTAQANEEKVVRLIEKQTQAAELALAQDWEKKLQEKRSEYEVKIAEIQAQARVYSQKVRAEGQAQRSILEANGKLALARAEALGKQLRTEALNSTGGRILIGLDAAENLEIPSVTLNSDDPAVPMILDLNSLTKLLVGNPPAQTQASTGESDF